ncbi:MAG: hypothetical protein R2741_02425 [Methanolobus sp.]
MRRVASKRNGAMRVVVISQITGITLLTLYALISGENIPAKTDIIWSVLAGLTGGAGHGSTLPCTHKEKNGIVGPVTQPSMECYGSNYLWDHNRRLASCKPINRIYFCRCWRLDDFKGS